MSKGAAEQTIARSATVPLDAVTRDGVVCWREVST